MSNKREKYLIKFFPFGELYLEKFYFQLETPESVHENFSNSLLIIDSIRQHPQRVKFLVTQLVAVLTTLNCRHGDSIHDIQRYLEVLSSWKSGLAKNINWWTESIFDISFQRIFKVIKLEMFQIKCGIAWLAVFVLAGISKSFADEA